MGKDSLHGYCRDSRENCDDCGEGSLHDDVFFGEAIEEIV
jgi:hypothetical protein